jgi:hypothetical protein
MVPNVLHEFTHNTIRLDIRIYGFEVAVCFSQTMENQKKAQKKKNDEF